MKHSPFPWPVDRVGCALRQPQVSKRRRIQFPPDHDGIQDAAWLAELTSEWSRIRGFLQILDDEGHATSNSAIVSKARELLALPVFEQ